MGFEVVMVKTVGWLMVIGFFNVVDVPVVPAEADSPLLVDTYAVLTLSFAAERLQLRRETGTISDPELFGLLVRETLYHLPPVCASEVPLQVEILKTRTTKGAALQQNVTTAYYFVVHIV
jgi:hypothetical protein